MRLFFKILILGGLIFVVSLLVVGNFRINQKRQEFRLKTQNLKTKIDQLHQEKETLESKISQSETQDFLEKVAREELNLKKEGEKVVAFPIVKESQEKEEGEEQSFWEKLLEKFKIINY